MTGFAIPASTQKLYLSPVLDGFNSEIIAYNLSTSPNLKQAIVDYINYYNNKRIKIKLKPQRQVLLANLVTFVDFTLPIKSMLLSVLTSDTMNLETF